MSVTPTRSETLRVSPATAATGTRTLAIDIGGTGLKALVLGPDGAALTERVRVETPRRATITFVEESLGPLGVRIARTRHFDAADTYFPHGQTSRRGAVFTERARQ